jgi:hypothetical protein
MNTLRIPTRIKPFQPFSNKTLKPYILFANLDRLRNAQAIFIGNHNA